MKKLVIFSLFALALSGIFSPAYASPEGASKFIENLGSQVMNIAGSSGSDAKKEQKLKKLFANSVDFNWVSNFVLGKHKRSAEKAQLTRYKKAYQGFVINSYTKRFKDYAGETFKMVSSRQEGKGKYRLSTEIIRPNAANVVVDYKVRKRGSGYKVIDIIVEGVSLITTQRAEFNSVINRESLDYLISNLEKRA